MRSAVDFFLGRSSYFKYFFRAPLRFSFVFLDRFLMSWYPFLLGKFDRVTVVFKSIGDISILQNASVSKQISWQHEGSSSGLERVAGTSLFVGCSSIFIGSHPFSKIQEYNYILPSFYFMGAAWFFCKCVGVFF